jgi:hypothetical protein
MIIGIFPHINIRTQSQRLTALRSHALELVRDAHGMRSPAVATRPR